MLQVRLCLFCQAYAHWMQALGSPPGSFPVQPLDVGGHQSTNLFDTFAVLKSKRRFSCYKNSVRPSNHSARYLDHDPQAQQDPFVGYGRLGLGKYLLLMACPIVPPITLMRLPIVPSCMRLARASSSADCVTEASVASSSANNSQHSHAGRG